MQITKKEAAGVNRTETSETTLICGEAEAEMGHRWYRANPAFRSGLAVPAEDIPENVHGEKHPAEQQPERQLP